MINLTYSESSHQTYTGTTILEPQSSKNILVQNNFGDSVRRRGIRWIQRLLYF